MSERVYRFKWWIVRWMIRFTGWIFRLIVLFRSTFNNFLVKVSSGYKKCSVFCGRSCSGCVGCPWGWFANPPHLPRDPQVTINQTLNAQCQPCIDTFDAYDWLFVIFHILCTLLLHYQARRILDYPRTNEVLLVFSRPNEVFELTSKP